jgi:hypothetical protein
MHNATLLPILTVAPVVLSLEPKGRSHMFYPVSKANRSDVMIALGVLIIMMTALVVSAFI